MAVPQASVPPSPADEEWYARVAATLNAADADAILLYGVPDKESSKKLAGLLKPQRYAVASEYAATANGPKGPLIGEPFAVFTRKERMAGRAMPWSDTGRNRAAGRVLLHDFPAGASRGGALRGHDARQLDEQREQGGPRLLRPQARLRGAIPCPPLQLARTTYTNTTFAFYLTGDFTPNLKGGVDDGSRFSSAPGSACCCPG